MLEPDMTRVVRLQSTSVVRDNQPVGATYTCTVTVEGRTNIDSGTYLVVIVKQRSTTVMVTGESRRH